MIELEEMLAAGVCDCGQPLAGHPPLRPAKPWGVGRPCTREVAGTQLAAGSSALVRGPRRVEAQETWGRDGKYSSPKAHEPTREQQVTIRSKANREARA